MNRKQALEQHNKWLAKMGVNTSKPKKPKGLYSIPDYSVNPVVPTSNLVGNGFKKAANQYTGASKHIVGLAYHKGNYTVLSEQEASDPATGKRRC